MCTVLARERLETVLEPLTMVTICPGDASNLSGALGGVGQSGAWRSNFEKVAASLDAALLGICKSW